MREAFRGSAVVRVLRHSQIIQRFVTAFRALADRLPDNEDTSTDDNGSDEPTADSSGLAAGSALFKFRNKLTATTGSDSSGLATGSVLLGLLAGLQRWITGSWLYRWLTAEPDPDVIVIDLRETWLVGPVLQGLDRVIGGLTTIGGGSGLASLAGRGHRLVVARPVQLASAVLGGVVLVLVTAMVATGTLSVLLLGVVVVLTICVVIGSRLSWPWAEVRETRLVRALIAAFEPPEPPDRQHESGDPSDDERSRGE